MDIDVFRHRLRLRHLRCFVAVAQSRQLGAAADELGLTQPAVSKTLSELEALAGARLLARRRSGTELTPDGLRFLHHATRILQDLDEAAHAMLDRGAPRRETVRVGALPSLIPGIVADAVVDFRAAHPDIALQVHTDRNRGLITALKADLLDVVVGRMDDPAVMEGLWFEMLDAEPLVLAVRRGHPLAAAKTVAVADIMACALVVPASGTVPRHNTESLLARHGLALRENCLETTDAYLSRLATQGSDAVWFAPWSAAARAVAAGDLVLLPFDTQGSEEPLGLLRRNDRLLAGGAEAFIAAVRAFRRR